MTSAHISRRSWGVWAIGAGVYMLAVFNRSTLGVAGPDALTRFGITASQLAVFVTLQLVVYAGMQVPAGVLVDRFGPRRMLLAAVLVMAVGQLGFAFLPCVSPGRWRRGRSLAAVTR